MNYSVRNSETHLVATVHQEGWNLAAVSQPFVSAAAVKKSRPILAMPEQPVPWVPIAGLAMRRTTE